MSSWWPVSSCLCTSSVRGKQWQGEEELPDSSLLLYSVFSQSVSQSVGIMGGVSRRLEKNMDCIVASVRKALLIIPYPLQGHPGDVSFL